MTSLNHMNNYYQTKLQTNTNNNIFLHNNHNLIENIPKLNLQGIINPDKNNISKSRNNKILLDKHIFFSPKNNINLSQKNKNSNNDNENKYETDKNFPNICYNKIFDYYELDKFDTNNSTSQSSKNNISSFSNNNKKHKINKTVRKKKIINLKSFLNEKKIKLNKKYYLDKFISILRKIFKRKVIQKLYNNTNDNLSKIDKRKLKNSQEKIIKSNDKNNEKNKNKDNLVSISSINLMKNNDCYNYNNLNNSGNNYLYYIEQISSRYNQEKDENIFNMFKYKPTNISFVTNNFPYINNIFNSISNQFELIKEHIKINDTMQTQILLYKKYYGDIEAINEEDNESEEIKHRKSSRRNEDNSLNDSKSIDDNIDFSTKKLLNNMKLKNNKIPLNKNQSRLFNLTSPIYDNNKICINIPINTIDKINELYYNNKVKKNEINYFKQKDGIKNINVTFDVKNIKRYNRNISKSSSFKINHKRKIDKNNIVLKSNQEPRVKEKNNYFIIDETKSKKLIFSLILFFVFFMKFLSINSK